MPPPPSRHRPCRFISPCKIHDSNRFSLLEINRLVSFSYFQRCWCHWLRSPLFEFLYETFFLCGFLVKSHMSRCWERALFNSNQSWPKFNRDRPVPEFQGIWTPLRWEWRWGYTVVFQIWCSPNQLPRSSLCPGVVSLTLPYFHYWYHPPSLDPSIHVIAKNDFLILRLTGNDFTECQTC